MLLIVVISYYRKEAVLNQKVADLLASRIAKSDNPELHAATFNAALYTDVEERVYKLIMKHRDLSGADAVVEDDPSLVVDG
jgi:hypothetical protein